MSKNGIAKQKGIGILDLIDIVNLIDTTQFPYKNVSFSCQINVCEIANFSHLPQCT